MNLEDTISFAEAREMDRQNAKSLGGRQNRCWRCGDKAIVAVRRRTSCDAFNTMCEKCNKVRHFATRCNRETLRSVWGKKSLIQRVSKKTGCAGHYITAA